MNAGISIATAGAKVAKPAHESHRPFVFYAAAASVMLVAALALIHYGQGQQPVKIAPPEEPPRAVAEQGKVPPEKVGGDKDKDKETITEDKPPEGEAVFEGMTAAQWEAQLRRDAAGANYALSGSKGVHALSVLGRDALPQIVNLTRSQDNNCRNAAIRIIEDVQWEKADLPHIFELLKNDDYARRKAGVQILGVMARNDSDLVAAVRQALRPLLTDRDKAIIEIAHETIGEMDAQIAVQATAKNVATDAALSMANRALAQDDFQKAMESARQAATLKPDDPRAQELLDLIQYRINKMKAGVKTDPVANIDLPPGPGVPVVPDQKPGGISGAGAGSVVAAADPWKDEQSKETAAEKIVKEANDFTLKKQYTVARSILTIKILNDPYLSKTQAAAVAHRLLDQIQAELNAPAKENSATPQNPEKKNADF